MAEKKEFTHDEMLKELEEHDNSNSLLNALIVEKDILQKQGLCWMKKQDPSLSLKEIMEQGPVLVIPDLDELITALQAYHTACGPYTNQQADSSLIKETMKMLEERSIEMAGKRNKD